jgi:hypothetical protein
MLLFYLLSNFKMDFSWKEGNLLNMTSGQGHYLEDVDKHANLIYPIFGKLGFMKVEFRSLSYDELKHALKEASSVHKIEILEEVIIPEANVFLCRHNGKRFNVYFDLVYGSEIKAVDRIDKDELITIETLICTFIN